MADTHVFDWTSLDSCQQIIDPTGSKSVDVMHSGALSSHLLTLPPHAGEGYIELITLGEDASMLIFNASWQKDFSFPVADRDRVRFNFGLELDISMAFEESMELELHEPSWRFINNISDTTIFERLHAGSKTVWVTLCLKPSYLTGYFGEALLNHPAVEKLLTKPSEHAVHNEYSLDHRLNQIVGNITSCHLDRRFYLPYLQSKTTELLCIVFDTITGQNSEQKVPVIIREKDKKAIRMARELIRQNLANPPSIRELCLLVGMNRNKLHYGFKSLFNMPIAQFIQEHRLIEAHRLLTETDLPVSQVALEVGFKHQSSLSTSFKNMYGVSPKHLRGSAC